MTACLPAGSGREKATDDLRTQVILDRLTSLARLVGYLSRHLDPETSAHRLAERISYEIEGIDAYIYPSAAELQAEFFAISGDHDLAVEEALRIVDERAALVRALLRREKR